MRYIGKVTCEGIKDADFEVEYSEDVLFCNVGSTRVDITHYGVQFAPGGLLTPTTAVLIGSLTRELFSPLDGCFPYGTFTREGGQLKSGEGTTGEGVPYTHITVTLADGYFDFGGRLLSKAYLIGRGVKFLGSLGAEADTYAGANACLRGKADDIESITSMGVRHLLKDTSEGGLYYETMDDVVAAHPDKKYDWLRGVDYKLVTDDTLDDVCHYLSSNGDLLFYDTETTGLDITFRSRYGEGSQLVGTILSIKEGESFFFPVRMRKVTNLCCGDDRYFMGKYMKSLLEGKNVVLHNGAFDWKVSYIYGVNVHMVHDTQILYCKTVLNSLALTSDERNKDVALAEKGGGKGMYSASLKALTAKYLNRDALKLSDLVKSGVWDESTKFWDLPADLVRLYACADTDNTRGLFVNAMDKNLLSLCGGNTAYDIEVRFSYAVGYQEFYGHKLDIANLNDVKVKNTKGLEDAQKAMTALAKVDFNPSSSTQLSHIMYDVLGMPVLPNLKLGVNGKPGSSKDTLNKLLDYADTLCDDEATKKFDFCRELQKYRDFESVISLTKKFPEELKAVSYLFSETFQMKATTGRVSTKGPNYQGYNDIVRHNIIARDGYYMTDCDYSSVESRVLASMAGLTKAIEGFNSPDFDYHRFQASHLFDTDYALVTKSQRKKAKVFDFGIPYGMSIPGFADRLFGKVDKQSLTKAQVLYDKFFEGQDELRHFFTPAQEAAKVNGYCETFFGSRRWFKKGANLNSVSREAGNFTIQGTAADLYKIAVGNLFEVIVHRGWLGRVLMPAFVHDELLAEVHKSINPCTWLKVLKTTYEVKIDGWCPLYMGFGIGMNWDDAKHIECPLRLQSYWADTYGDIGHPDWNFDPVAFSSRMPKYIYDFEVDYAISQVKDQSLWGKCLSPEMCELLVSLLERDKVYLSTYGTLSSEFLATGVKLGDLSVHALIDMFCVLHGLDRLGSKFLDVADAKTLKVADIIIKEDIETPFEKRMRTQGIVVDMADKKIYIQCLDGAKMNTLLPYCTLEGGFSLTIRTPDGKDTPTPSFVPESKVSDFLHTYLSLGGVANV